MFENLMDESSGSGRTPSDPMNSGASMFPPGFGAIPSVGPADVPNVLNGSYVPPSIPASLLDSIGAMPLGPMRAPQAPSLWDSMGAMPDIPLPLIPDTEAETNIPCYHPLRRSPQAAALHNKLFEAMSGGFTQQCSNWAMIKLLVPTAFTDRLQTVYLPAVQLMMKRSGAVVAVSALPNAAIDRPPESRPELRQRPGTTDKSTSSLLLVGGLKVPNVAYAGTWLMELSYADVKLNDWVNKAPMERHIFQARVVLPRSSISRFIGRGGETIRLVQEESLLNVSVSSLDKELGERVFIMSFCHQHCEPGVVHEANRERLESLLMVLHVVIEIIQTDRNYSPNFQPRKTNGGRQRVDPLTGERPTRQNLLDLMMKSDEKIDGEPSGIFLDALVPGPADEAEVARMLGRGGNVYQKTGLNLLPAHQALIELHKSPPPTVADSFFAWPGHPQAAVPQDPSQMYQKHGSSAALNIGSSSNQPGLGGSYYSAMLNHSWSAGGMGDLMPTPGNESLDLNSSFNGHSFQQTASFPGLKSMNSSTLPNSSGRLPTPFMGSPPGLTAEGGGSEWSFGVESTTQSNPMENSIDLKDLEIKILLDLKTGTFTGQIHNLPKEAKAINNDDTQLIFCPLDDFAKEVQSKYMHAALEVNAAISVSSSSPTAGENMGRGVLTSSSGAGVNGIADIVPKFNSSRETVERLDSF